MDFAELSETQAWTVLKKAIEKATNELGYKIQRVPGRGRSNVWMTEKNGRRAKASFRTTRDRWIAFPPLDGGAHFKTLDDVDQVFVAAVDDRDDPRAVEVYEFGAEEVRECFRVAHSARVNAGMTVRDDFGMWVNLDRDDRGIASSVGSGLADRHQPVAVYPLASLIEGASADENASDDERPAPRDGYARETSQVRTEVRPKERPTTIADVLATARREIAMLADVRIEAVKLDLKIEY